VVHWRLLCVFPVHHIITSLHLHVRFNTKIWTLWKIVNLAALRTSVLALYQIDWVTN
jgi:hypothetical protein